MALTPIETPEANAATAPEPVADHTLSHVHSPAHEPDSAHDHAPDTDAPHDHQHTHGPSLNPELMREIQVESPAEEVSKSFRTVIKKYQKLARIPGFRAGKVPESLIRTRFAKDLRQEVMDELLSERFRRSVEEQNLRPISQPQVTELFLVDGQALRFKAAFEVLPEIAVDGYDQVKVQRPAVELTPDEFDAELARVLDSHATVEPVDEDRALAEGDWAEIQFRGEIKDLAQTVTEDGVQSAAPAQPVTGDDVLIEIGGKNTLAAFNDALCGAKVGQELTFEVSYPAEFGEPRLAGQTVAYDVTIKAIKRKTYPERDADFARQLGNHESWEEFETGLREHASERKKDSLEAAAREQMLDQMVERFQFPVPETFIQQQIDARLDRGLRALAQQGMTSDAMRKLDFNRLREAQRDQAVKEVKVSLLLDRIAETEGIAVSADELDRELLMISLQTREPLETLRERLAQDGGLNRIREQMRREKTGSVLFEKLAS